MLTWRGLVQAIRRANTKSHSRNEVGIFKGEQKDSSKSQGARQRVRDDKNRQNSLGSDPGGRLLTLWSPSVKHSYMTRVEKAFTLLKSCNKGKERQNEAGEETAITNMKSQVMPRDYSVR